MQKTKVWLLFSLLFIQTLSLVTIWSTMPSLFLTQVSFFFVGVLILYLISRLDLTLLFSFANLWYVLSLLLLFITYFVGRNVRGSVRWIDFGFFNLQTSEIIKPFLAIFYSSYLAKNSLKNTKDYLLFLFLALLPAIIVAKQPDLGSALTLIFLPISLLAVSGQLVKIIISLAIFLLIAIPLEAKFLKPYQRERLVTFVNPYRDPSGAGYNVIQATIAVGSGGLIGKGVRLGTQSHLNFLPERHTDFIFASFAEEFGLIGVSVLFFSFFTLFRYCLDIARRQKEKQNFLLIFSIFSVFIFQFVVNVGMNLGVMPVTGITLPIFSYGGSSLISFAILLGVLIRQLDLLPPIEI